MSRLERHAKIVDQTAIATELLRASEHRTRMEAKHREEKIIQCETWLRPSNVRNLHNMQVSARLNGTCDWIASDEKFRKWIDKGCSENLDRILCVSGAHGCGKSILSSSIVSGLEKENNSVLYFSFSSTDASRRTPESLVRTLLWQLIQKTTTENGIESLRDLVFQGHPTTSELWQTFGAVANSSNIPIYCVIDGVDECTDFDHAVFKIILDLVEVSFNLRIILLGRPHAITALIQPVDQSIHVIDITKANTSHDIDAFIADEISRSEILRIPSVHDQVFTTIKEKSEGMFLWVRLMIIDLRKSSTRSEMMERLHNLPCGLEEAYQLVFLRLVQKLDSFELRLARKVLALTIVSCRPLTFEEIRYVFALDSRSTTKTESPLEHHLLLQPVERLVEICGGLVSVVDGCLRLIHSSVRDFLTRPEHRWVSAPGLSLADFRVDPVETNGFLTSLSLDYLGMEKSGLPLANSNLPHGLEGYYPFLDYASIYTVFHLNRSGPISVALQGKLNSLLQSAQSISWIEQFAGLLMEDPSLDSQMSEIITLQSALSDAGTNMGDLFTTFTTQLERELVTRVRSFGSRDPRVEQWQIFLRLAEEGEFDGLRSTGRLSDSTVERREGTDQPMDQLRSLESDSEDPSAVVSRLILLLQNHTVLPGGRQVEILLRLQSSLRKIHVMIDPLKVLFKLLLRKASAIPVYALRVVGDFYWRLNKYQETLEVDTAALQKVKHLEAPIKYRLYYDIGVSQYYLKEARKDAGQTFEVAYHGFKKLFGDRNGETLKCLYWMGCSKILRYQYKEALILYNRMMAGQSSVPELSGDWNSNLQYRRGRAYRYLGRYTESVMIMKHALRRWEKVLREDHWSILEMKIKIASAFSYSCQDRQALGWIRKVLKGEKSSLKLSSEQNLILQNIEGLAYQRLGRYKKSTVVMTNALEQWESAMGTDRWCILELKFGIARAFYNSCRDRKALEWAQISLSGHVKTFEPDHQSYWWVIEIEDHIGKIYRAMGRYDEELKWLETTYLRRVEIHGAEDRRTIQVKERIDNLRGYLSADYRNMEESSLNIFSRASSIASSHSLDYSEEHVEDFESNETSRNEEIDDGNSGNSLYSLESPSNASSCSLLSVEEIMDDVEHDENSPDEDQEDESSLYSLEASSSESLQRPDSSDEFFNDFEYPEIF